MAGLKTVEIAYTQQHYLYICMYFLENVCSDSSYCLPIR